MPISMSQLLQVAVPAAMHGIRRNYVLGEIIQRANNANIYHTTLQDRNSGNQVSIAWTTNEEALLTTERLKVDFARALIDNAVRALDYMQIEHGVPENLHAQLRFDPGAVEMPAQQDGLSDIQTVDFT